MFSNYVKNICIKFSVIFIALFLVSSCGGYPKTQTVVNTGRSGISFVGGKGSSKIFVDKIEMGKVKDYRSKNKDALHLEHGSHLVEVVPKSGTIYKKRVFLSDNEINEINLD